MVGAGAVQRHVHGRGGRTGIAGRIRIRRCEAVAAARQAPRSYSSRPRCRSRVAVPSCVVPSNTFTVLLASAVPLSVTTLVGETELLLITGAVGATVSIVTLSADDAALVVPDTVSVAVKLCVPFAKAPW